MSIGTYKISRQLTYPLFPPSLYLEPIVVQIGGQKVVTIIHKRADPGHSLYFGAPEWTMFRSSNDRKQSDHQPQNTDKIDNLASACSVATGKVYTFVFSPWIR